MSGPRFFKQPYWDQTHPETFWIHQDPPYVAFRLSSDCRTMHISRKYALKYKWQNSSLPVVLRSFRYSECECKVLFSLALDPQAAIPEPDEYRTKMSVCMHHPRGQIHHAVKSVVHPPTINGVLASNKTSITPHDMTAQIQGLVWAIQDALSEPIPPESSKSGSLPRSKSISPPKSAPKEGSPKQQGRPRLSPSRRQSISSDDNSIVVRMHVDVPVKSVPPANPIDNPPAASVRKSSRIQSPKSEPSPIPTYETLLEWSARMRRYQQEEIEYLGLGVIKSNSHRIAPPNSPPKSPRNSPTLTIPPNNKSLSNERFAEWLVSLSPSRPTIAVSESSTIADTAAMDVFLDAMALSQLNSNVCRTYGAESGNKCQDWAYEPVIDGPLIDI